MLFCQEPNQTKNMLNSLLNFDVSEQAFLALIHLIGKTRSSCSFILYRESDDGALTLLMKDFACVMSLSVEGRITCVCQHLSN